MASRRQFFQALCGGALEHIANARQKDVIEYVRGDEEVGRMFMHIPAAGRADDSAANYIVILTPHQAMLWADYNRKEAREATALGVDNRLDIKLVISHAATLPSGEVEPQQFSYDFLRTPEAIDVWTLMATGTDEEAELQRMTSPYRTMLQQTSAAANGEAKRDIDPLRGYHFIAHVTERTMVIPWGFYMQDRSMEIFSGFDNRIISGMSAEPVIDPDTKAPDFRLGGLDAHRVVLAQKAYNALRDQRTA